MSTLNLQPVPPISRPGAESTRPALDTTSQQLTQTTQQLTQASTSSQLTTAGLNMNFPGSNPTTTGASTGAGTATGLTTEGLGTGLHSVFGANSFLGLGLGTGLSSLVLPSNMSQGTRSLFAAAVEFPVITALATTFWTSSLFRSPLGGGFAGGLFAGIFLGSQLGGRNDG